MPSHTKKKRKARKRRATRLAKRLFGEENVSEEHAFVGPRDMRQAHTRDRSEIEPFALAVAEPAGIVSLTRSGKDPLAHMNERLRDHGAGVRAIRNRDGDVLLIPDDPPTGFAGPPIEEDFRKEDERLLELEQREKAFIRRALARTNPNLDV